MEEISKCQEAPAPRPRRRGPTSFTKAKQEAFLEALTRTCNVSAACEEVNVGSPVAYRLRCRNPEFRAAWDAALGMGMADLELQLLKRARKTKPATGETEEGELADPEFAMLVLKDYHQRQKIGPKPARPLKPADRQDVEDWFIAKLAIVKRRLARKPRKGVKR